MNQEDIEKILICKGAIENNRAFNLTRIEALNTAKSVDEAKTIIESKLNKETFISKDTTPKLKQEIKNILEEERTKHTIEMNNIIKEQGFDSVSSLSDWYHKVIFETYKEYYPVEGECDLCGEKEVGNQPCVEFYGRVASCAGNRVSGVPNTVFSAFMKYYNIENKYLEVDGIIYGRPEEGGCPVGHGFSLDTKKIKDMPDVIDLNWEI